MLTSIAAQIALLLGAQATTMPPTPEQMASQLAQIPRCVPLPVTLKSQGRSSGQEASKADRIADGLRDALTRFPNTACKERNPQ